MEELIKDLRNQVRAKFNDLAYEDTTLCELKLTSKEQLFDVVRKMYKEIDTGFKATDTMINHELVRITVHLFNNDYTVVLDNYGYLKEITFTKE